MLELCTGQSETFLIIGSLRWKSYFLDVVVAYKQMRGNRGDQLQLPPKWHLVGQGIMTLIVARTRVRLLHNFLPNWTVDVADSVLPPFGIPQDLYLDYNFSESRVTLKSIFYSLRDTPPAH